MLESSFLAEEIGLNHMLKLCWFTRFEMALSMDESKSGCMVGASECELRVGPLDGEPRDEPVANNQLA